MGSGTPQEMRDWMEYCNQPSGSSLAEERAANGSPEPFNVRIWGVGNENWGCGGNMTGEEYATEYRRFATFLRGFGSTRPFLVACGPSGNDQAWTKQFIASVRPRGRGGQGRGGPAPTGPAMGYAMHYYSNGQLEATKFNVEAMQRQLSSFARVEEAVLQQRQLLDSVDPNKSMGLMVDEWGVWDRIPPEDTKKYGALWMQSTMRSAVAAGMGLNVFHRQADKLYMCNIAQIVNVLQSVILCHENNCIKTTSYYAFELQKPHRSKTAVQVATGDATPLGISVSASRSPGEMALTFINPRHDVEMAVDCGITGATAQSAKGRILSHPDYNACNTFEAPNTVVPKDLPVTVQGGRVRLSLPPISMASVIARLA
ncbi:MAG: alpha-L-arabinofuranosidase C-terminal domain-containing protein, partial [Bryobacteraceae bacterium]